MHRVLLAAQVTIESIGIERCKGSNEPGHGHQAGVKGIVGRTLVIGHVLAPEALALGVYIPVRQIVVDKGVNVATSARGVEVVHLNRHVLDKCVQTRENPTVNLCSVSMQRLSRNRRYVAVHIGVLGKELIGVEQCSEELATHLSHAGWVELQVVPRLGDGHQVEAHSVRTVLVNHLERVDDVTLMFRHLVALCIKHQTGGDNILESNRVEDHRSDGVQRKEPATCLVDALVDVVSGIELSVVHQFAVLKRIVHLSVRHGADVEPHVDEVGLTLHRLACGRHQFNIVHVRTVHVDTVIVLLAHVAGHEAFLLQRVALHDASLDSILNLIVELL